MKILFLAHIESKFLWDYFDKSKLEGVDLIISCGDLSANYLSFLATFTHAPILYVRGNHDGRYEQKPPEGQPLPPMFFQGQNRHRPAIQSVRSGRLFAALQNSFPQ